MPIPPKRGGTWEDASREQRPRRGGDAIEALMERAERLALLGPLGADFDYGDMGDESGAAGFQSQLLERVRRRAANAWDLPRLGSALTWFEAFLTATRRVPFVPALGSDAAGVRGQIWNQVTLDQFLEFLLSSRPLGKANGEVIKADYAASLVACIRTLRSREARYEVAPAAGNLVAPLAQKATRRDEAPPGDRELRRGLRAMDLAAAARAGFDRSTPQGKINWAALIAAHNLLLRGGEAGAQDDVPVDSRRVITWASIVWQRPCAESGWRPWLIVWVFPIKDTHARGKPWPVPIVRRHDGALGADPLCAYDAILLAWWSRRAPAAALPRELGGEWWAVAPAPTATTADDQPFFTSAPGVIFRTSTFRKLVQSAGAAAGIPADELGAKSCRIGGATDLRERLGVESQRTVKQRGRWCSDVASVYQRPLLAEQLHASGVMGSAVGADLEQICTGWAFPAVRGS